MAELRDWVASNIPQSRQKTVPFIPFSRLFYPTLKVPPALQKLEGHVVVQVTGDDELSSILRTANTCHEPVYVRQGTGLLSLDMTPGIPPGSVVIDLRRMRSIEVQIRDGYVDVGPAVTLADVNDHLASYGRQLPISVAPVTWGGLASINQSGHVVDAVSGKPGDGILGLSAVMPDGTVIYTGTRSPRKMVGPDLTRVLVGGQCLFGVITGVRVRTQPQPAEVARGWASFDDMDSALDAVAELYRRGRGFPTALELMDSRFARISGLSELTRAGNLMLFSMESQALGQAKEEAHEFAELLNSCGASVVERDSRDSEWDWLWSVREAPFEHMHGTAFLLGEALDVRISQLHEATSQLDVWRREVELEWSGLQTFLVAHVGSGTLHPLVGCPEKWSFIQRVKVAAMIRSSLMDLKIGLGATLGEQGIFPEHAEWYRRHFGVVSFGYIEAMKRAFDPNNVLNPGRLEPVTMMELLDRTDALSNDVAVEMP